MKNFNHYIQLKRNHKNKENHHHEQIYLLTTKKRTMIIEKSSKWRGGCRTATRNTELLAIFSENTVLP